MGLQRPAPPTSHRHLRSLVSDLPLSCPFECETKSPKGARPGRVTTRQAKLLLPQPPRESTAATPPGTVAGCAPASALSPWNNVRSLQCLHSNLVAEGHSAQPTEATPGPALSIVRCRETQTLPLNQETVICGRGNGVIGEKVVSPRSQTVTRKMQRKKESVRLQSHCPLHAHTWKQGPRRRQRLKKNRQ